MRFFHNFEYLLEPFDRTSFGFLRTFIFLLLLVVVAATAATGDSMIIFSSISKVPVDGSCALSASTLLSAVDGILLVCIWDDAVPGALVHFSPPWFGFLFQDTTDMRFCASCADSCCEDTAIDRRTVTHTGFTVNRFNLCNKDDSLSVCVSVAAKDDCDCDVASDVSNITADDDDAEEEEEEEEVVVFRGSEET